LGYFDGVTANLFRHDTAGRRYYTPLAKWGPLYEVDDPGAGRIARDWKRFYQAMFFLILGLGIITSWTWKLLWLAVPLGLLAIPFGYWTARGLRRGDIAYDALVPVSRAEAMSRQSRAIGRRTLGWVLASSVLMLAVGIWAAVTTGRPVMWFSAGFFALCVISIAVQWRRAG
jgi:hypothetical protein